MGREQLARAGRTAANFKVSARSNVVNLMKALF